MCAEFLAPTTHRSVPMVPATASPRRAAMLPPSDRRPGAESALSCAPILSQGLVDAPVKTLSRGPSRQPPTEHPQRRRRRLRSPARRALAPGAPLTVTSSAAASPTGTPSSTPPWHLGTCTPAPQLVASRRLIARPRPAPPFPRRSLVRGPTGLDSTEGPRPAVRPLRRCAVSFRRSPSCGCDASAWPQHRQQPQPRTR